MAISLFTDPDARRGRASEILTAPRVFALDDEVGEGRSNSDKDVEAARLAFAWAGYDAESDLTRSIRSFQTDQRLKVDGWMRPGGETARALDDTIAPKVLAWRAKHPQEPNQPTAGGGVQLAQAQGLLPFAPLVAPVIAGAIVNQLNRRASPKESWDSPQESPRSRRMIVTEPTPPVPPKDPDDDKPDIKEQILPVPQEVPIFRGKPINEILKNDPVIFEAVSDELRKALEAALESHPGDKTTKKGNKLSVQFCIDEFQKGWGRDATLKHVGGAGQPEKYRKSAVTGGLKGSSHPDMTLEGKASPDGSKRVVDLNSGRTLKDGRTPIADERRQLEKLMQNLNVPELANVTAGFLPKLRPDMVQAEWEGRVREMCKAALIEAFGEPPNKASRQ